MNGTVAWYQAAKGYGYITGEDGNDYFVYNTEIVMDGFRKLKNGQKVTFNVENSAKGNKAVSVVPCSS